MVHFSLPLRATDLIAERVRAAGKYRSSNSTSVRDAQGIMDAKSLEEFVLYLKRYEQRGRLVKDLTIDDLTPIRDGCGPRPASNMAPDRAEANIDQPFIDHLDARDQAEATAAASAAARAPSSRFSSRPSAAESNPPVAPSKEEQAIPCKSHKSLPPCPDDSNLTHELLNKLAILRLNGGLGTSMGCKGPKSGIEVRNSQSFLDMAVHQVEYLNTKHGVDVPLVLMNSIHTDEETKRILSRYENRHVFIRHFRQSCFPRVNRSSLEPLATEGYTPETEQFWYPPGHGDVFGSLARSGMLQQLISMGKEYIFISNIDNLGATVDLNILYHLMENDYEFCMEVTKRESQDLFGGTLVQYEGKPLLLEAAGVNKQLGDILRRDKRFDKFNTNNLWVNLRNLQSLFAVKKSLDIPVMLREKTTVDARGVETGTIAFKSAAGAAISLFKNVVVISVSRARFLPVKTTDDLFAVQSDLFTIQHGALRLSNKRTISPPVPTVKLGPNFRSIEEYSKRLPFGVPDLVELEHLTVSGDVHFRNHVQLKGTVIIVAEKGQHIDICSGSVIRDKVITGNLTILPH
mmetsp:Transcript_5211/g.9386  ORF Transcript_5211/g.9386 Transcript_5211/m.9386 type:complete len:574 (-) Transcript_5211:420-2141(-)